MLNQLPTSLQYLILLEWVSPKAVCRVARAGSAQLRRVVLTSPCAFRAADGEVLGDGCVRWFQDHQIEEEEEEEEEGEGERSGGSASRLVLWTFVETHRWGTCRRRNGKLHSDGGDEDDDDSATAVYTDGSRAWYRDGLLHRQNDLPAIVWCDGMKEWYRNGLLHRENDLPALVWPDGSMGWYQNGKKHRDGDLPAFIVADGLRSWFQNGRLHRDGGGPAIIEADGTQMWFWHGTRVPRVYVRVCVLWQRVAAAISSAARR